MTPAKRQDDEMPATNPDDSRPLDADADVPPQQDDSRNTGDQNFDERNLEGDVVKDFDGVHVVTDRMSAPYLTGATIDFADTIEKQGFTIDNPNAGSSCACGDSFS